MVLATRDSYVVDYSIYGQFYTCIDRCRFESSAVEKRYAILIMTKLDTFTSVLSIMLARDGRQ